LYVSFGTFFPILCRFPAGCPSPNSDFFFSGFFSSHRDLVLWNNCSLFFFFFPLSFPRTLGTPLYCFFKFSYQTVFSFASPLLPFSFSPRPKSFLEIPDSPFCTYFLPPPTQPSTLIFSLPRFRLYPGAFPGSPPPRGAHKVFCSVRSLRNSHTPTLLRNVLVRNYSPPLTLTRGSFSFRSMPLGGIRRLLFLPPSHFIPKRVCFSIRDRSCPSIVFAPPLRGANPRRTRHSFFG